MPADALAFLLKIERRFGLRIIHDRAFLIVVGAVAVRDILIGGTENIGFFVVVLIRLFVFVRGRQVLKLRHLPMTRGRQSRPIAPWRVVRQNIQTRSSRPD